MWFSSFQIISDILADPEAFGLSDCIRRGSGRSDHGDDGGKQSHGEDPEMEKEKAMWEDHIHLSPAAHKVLSDRLWEAFRAKTAT